MTVNGHKKNMKRSCAMRNRQSMSTYGIVNVEKKQSERIENMLLPQVHEALRQNDPTSKAPSTQPSPIASKQSPSINRKRHSRRVLPMRRASKDWCMGSPATRSTISISIYTSNSSTSTTSAYLSPSSTSPRTSSTSDIEASSTSTSSA